MERAPPACGLSSALADRLRSAAHTALAKHAYGGAVFFAEQLASLADATSDDASLLAHAHLLSGAPRRALAALAPAGGPASPEPGVRHLAARCLAAAGQWEEVLDALGDGADGDGGEFDASGDPGLAADAWLLRGRAAAAADDTRAATAAYRTALARDARCYDAFDALVGGHLLSPGEEAALVQGLVFLPGDEWLRDMYAAKCSKEGGVDGAEAALAVLEAPVDGGRDEGACGLWGGGPASPGGAPTPASSPEGVPLARITRARAAAGRPGEEAGSLRSMSDDREGGADDHPRTAPQPPPGHGLAASADVAAARAECLLARGDAAGAFALTSALLARDPDAAQALPAHLAAAVDLGRRHDLFSLAHRLIAQAPGDGLGWYAAGCYYTACGSHAAARRHFGRATACSPRLVPAWLALGHAAAALDESDQAMAAYRSAARLFPGLTAPLVGLGAEHARTANAPLAEALLARAHALCPGDPLPCHELAALALRAGDAVGAEAWARAALDRAPQPVPAAWEPTLVLLGHALRRQRRFDEAETVYQAALARSPRSAGTHAALGLTRHAAGDADGAATAYHAALGLRPGDALAADLLADALREQAAGAAEWIGECDVQI